MNQPLRTKSVASMIVLASVISGCAAPQAHVAAATHFGGKTDDDLGLATRALTALNANDVTTAINLAERAVAKTPDDAGIRALLGNAYFSGGRFQSAESAYRDSLSIYSNQSQVVLKLALVQIAQGKNGQAVELLNASGSVLNPSDLGLALALAGHPADAIAMLEPAARQSDADATIRQNLALAHALAGDWVNARTIAAQDVPGDQLDARIHQWMAMASPSHPYDQVAALVGVKPAASDPGQPVRLALNKTDTQLAQMEAPKAVAAAVASPVPAFTQALAAAEVTPVPVVAVAPAPPPPRATTIATLAASAIAQAKEAFDYVIPHRAKAPAAKPVKRPMIQASVHRGNSPAVVQLGAYQSPERVLAAWNGAAHKYSALKAYLPMSARFASAKGTFYRLSVHGFTSDDEARNMCISLRRQGGTCFVRNVAGDTPVHYASR